MYITKIINWLRQFCLLIAEKLSLSVRLSTLNLVIFNDSLTQRDVKIKCTVNKSNGTILATQLKAKNFVKL